MNFDNLSYYCEELGLIFKIDEYDVLYVSTKAQPDRFKQATQDVDDYDFQPVDWYDVQDTYEEDNEIMMMIEDIQFGLIECKRTLLGRNMKAYRQAGR